jgi:hypothetical protein
VEGCGLIILAILAIAVVAAISQSNARDRARVAYQKALARLKQDPANPDLREETLKLGRAYCGLMRNRRGVALFDEVALSNDISAACAAAFRPQRQPVAIAQPSVESRLTNLAELRSKGLIDESEYTTRRQEILRDI